VRAIPIFDGHNDTLTDLFRPEEGRDRSFFERSEVGHLDLPRAREAGLVGGICAVFTPPPEGSPEREPRYGLTITPDGYDVTMASPVEHDYARAFTDSVIRFAQDLEARSQGQVSLVHSHSQLQRNLAGGVFSVVLHIEGAEAIGEDLSELKRYYAAGVRSLGLVWSRPNAFGCGVPFRFPHTPDTGPGLTPAGRSLVQACNRLGIVIDLAHINAQGFWDVAELTEAPLVVSHAAVHSLCRSTRNLTDDQIDAIGASNGLFGIMFEPFNLRPEARDGSGASLSDIVRHVDYVVNRIGVDHVALGSDFDGAQMPADLQDVTGLPGLIRALQDVGYDGAALEKIAYQNWFRVLQDSWKV
jgi:membrane dipeptidase